MSIKPIGNVSVRIIGVVRESSKPDLARRFGLKRDSIGYSDLAKTIGGADPVQLTVHVDELSEDPDALDYSSYTFLLPSRMMNHGISRGMVIQAHLVPVSTLAGISLWLARELDILY